jgi:hypothetical protein
VRWNQWQEIQGRVSQVMLCLERERERGRMGGGLFGWLLLEGPKAPVPTYCCSSQMPHNDSRSSTFFVPQIPLALCCRLLCLIHPHLFVFWGLVTNHAGGGRQMNGGAFVVCFPFSVPRRGPPMWPRIHTPGNGGWDRLGREIAVKGNFLALCRWFSILFF